METTRAMAPQLTAMSATLNVGQRSAPMPTSRKSTTPRGLRTRSMRFPTAPPATRPSANWRNRSPTGLVRDIRARTNTAISATVKKIHREYGPTWSPKAAPWLYTSRSWNQSPNTEMPGVRSSVASAISLVIRSSTTVPTAAAIKTRRSGAAIRGSAAFAIFLFLLAGNAEPGMRQGVQPFEVDLLAALLAVTKFLGIAVEPPQRLVHMPEIPALLRGKEELLLPLHRVGSLIRHMEGIGREIAVGGLQRGVE